MQNGLTAHPLLIVDDHRQVVSENGTRLGRPGPFGRERVVSALKLDNNPPQTQFPGRVIADANKMLLADPTTNTVLGDRAPLRISRLLKATRTRDTRGL